MVERWSWMKGCTVGFGQLSRVDERDDQDAGVHAPWNRMATQLDRTTVTLSQLPTFMDNLPSASPSARVHTRASVSWGRPDFPRRVTACLPPKYPSVVSFRNMSSYLICSRLDTTQGSAEGPSPLSLTSAIFLSRFVMPLVFSQEMYRVLGEKESVKERRKRRTVLSG